MRYVVGFLNLFDGEMKLELIEAENERDAIFKHSEFEKSDYQKWFREEEIKLLSLEDIKQSFFDTDCVVDVIAVGE